MKDLWNKFLQAIKRAPIWVFIVVYLVTALLIAGAIVALVLGMERTGYRAVAYVLFVLSAVALAFTVFTVVLLVPRIKGAFVRGLERRPFTARLLRDFGFRTVVVAIGAFAISFAFAGYNAYLGISSLSIWYGALAAYYFFLVLLRGGILASHVRHRKEDGERAKLKMYRKSGIVLLILNVALSAAIAQMIFDDRAFVYEGWTVIVVAAYAFFRITLAIYNLFRAKRLGDYTVQAIRNVTFVDAVVSVLATQTALLFAFGTGDLDVSLMNTVTGILVSALSVGTGVYMIVSASKKLKQSKEETCNDEKV